MVKKSEETWRPPANLGQDTPKKYILYLIRRVFDLQVSSALHRIRPGLMQLSGDVLEIGAGDQPYRHLINKDVRYKSLEWHLSNEHFGYKKPDTIYYQGGKFPFEDESFDFVFHTEVLEHVFDTRYFLAECHRVLKRDGKLLFVMPFAARYHYIPVDYWRITPSALKLLLDETGFSEILILARGTDITTVCYKINTLFFRLSLPRIHSIWKKAAGIIFGCLAFIPFLILTIMGNITIKWSIGSDDDPLGYFVEAKK